MAGSVQLLRVPIQLDSLFVDSEGYPLTSPMADFSKLPYYLSNGLRINAEPPTPNLAEAAFKPQLGWDADANSSDFRAPAGLHLHWALPDALTNGSNHNGETQFPPV